MAIDAPVSSLNVELGERSYEIVVGSNALGQLGDRLRTLFQPGRCAVVTNPTVARLYLDVVLRELKQAGFQPTVIEVADGEQYKNLQTLGAIYDGLAGARLERSAPVLALGGGVIGDLAGFAAATYLRGVPYVQLPTTLLAQVDSSVGGKTGVDHPTGKNLIGAFYQPRLVLSDIAALKTLPQREFRAGLVEVIKYGAILDADLFALIERDLEKILSLDEDLLQHIVERCCALKAEVVAQDERESGLRSILNFGHTLAHAIESLTEYKRYLHGEAVAIGMAFAAAVSAQRAICNADTARRIVQLLKRAGQAVDVPSDVLGPQLATAVAGDKKAAGGKVKFVCVEELGRVRFEYLTSAEIAELAEHRSAVRV